ncbi:guanine nucleotide exchange factor DBS-like isoform X1 [Haliotis asinina]|uniref:guanine nucleotide exchange factor DBS-like isoform X1 n=2 Tax=Haliotis asinina TaxID=109174 RepID=UPI003531B5C1
MSSSVSSPELPPLSPGFHEIEDEIAKFVENFKSRTSFLDRRLSLESGDSSLSGWTGSSAYSTTSDCTSTNTESPDKEGEGACSSHNSILRQKGIIAESRRISEWAWLTEDDDTLDIEKPIQWKNTSNAMDESVCHYSVLDVAQLLQSRFALLSGGKAKNGAPIITFSDCPMLPEVSEEDYRKVMKYLCHIPPLNDVESGYVLVIDRRQDGWSAVKSILLRISSYFPTHIQVVFLLQPKGFFQRAFADFRSKFVKEELEYRVILCDSPVEMLEHVDPSMLTTDVGGALEYDPSEWTEHRSAIEKFAFNVDAIGKTLNNLVKKLDETDLPNDVPGTETLIKGHIQERKEVMEDVANAASHGDTLLKCIRGDNSEVPLVKLTNVLELERLLVQLEETKKKFGEFWKTHEDKLRQCLKLREFEEEFKLIQYTIERSVETLETKMPETGESVTQVETQIRSFEEFELSARKELEQAERMRAHGEQLILDDHYAVDSIRPKCIELQRMCQQYKDLLRRRQEILSKSHDLQDRLDKANRWCTKGVDLLASQPIDRCQNQQGAEQALQDVESFLATSRELKLNNPREFRQLFESMMTPETRAVVQQVLKRMEDVQGMCQKRKESLCKMAARQSRPIQPVHPEPSPSPASTSHQVSPLRLDTTDYDPHLKRRVSGDTAKRSPLSLEKSARHRVDKSEIQHPGHLSLSGDRSNASSVSSSSLTVSDMSTTDSHNQRSSYSSMSVSSLSEMDTLQAKRRHVMNELIETENTYVGELQEILKGYYEEMDSRTMQHLIPAELVGNRHILFGNLEQICKFHQEHFLKELTDCREEPAKMGKCFVNRKEEFQMYSIYCQNKPKSENLRIKIGDGNSFFKECQRRLGHKLPLGAYLLKPIQRITKYQLLIKEMLRFTGEDQELESQLQGALDTVLSVLRYLNDSMHQVSIVGFSENLSEQGRLIMHGSFSVWTEHKKDKIRDLRFKPMHRHLFLYERALILCKKREENHSADDAVYSFKKKLKLSQVGLTENIKGDKKKFELWLRGREEVYIIQAPTMEVKDTWIKEVKKVLLNQFDQIKTHHSHIQKSQEDLSSHRRHPSDTPHSLDNWKSQQSFNNNPTVPIGLGMVSPTESPTSPPDYVEDEGGWSSGEFSNTDDDEYIPKIEPSYREHFVSLGDYFPVDQNELGLHEGDLVEVLRVGTNGWWYAKHLTSYLEGWVPSTYLESTRRALPSDSSSESLMPGQKEIYHSRSSLTSGTASTTSPVETTV